MEAQTRLRAVRHGLQQILTSEGKVKLGGRNSQMVLGLREIYFAPKI